MTDIAALSLVGNTYPSGSGRAGSVAPQDNLNRRVNRIREWAAERMGKVLGTRLCRRKSRQIDGFGSSAKLRNPVDRTQFF